MIPQASACFRAFKAASSPSLRPRTLALGFALCCLFAFTAVPAAAQDDFDAWLQDLREEALSRGISAATLDAALTGVRRNPKIVDLDRRQPEFTQTFWSYLDKRVTRTRIKRGKQLLVKHRKLLDRVYRKYGVPPHYLVAFWGLESNFGDFKGRFNVVEALATLAYDPRRAKFFRNQLFEALKILEQGHIKPKSMQGSWAGAMGHLQFIPSTFTQYAVDFNGDGRRNIWTDLPDVFGSAANYLNEIGWREEEIWGREVILPAKFDWDLAGLDTRRSVNFWRQQGVKRANGGRLPVSEITGSIILPAGHKGPAFLVYRNFRNIMVWNRSILYAVAVGHLADRLRGKGPLLAERDGSDRPLSRKEIEEIQSRLSALGFSTGTPDGVPGPRTRKAIRAYQRRAGMPADGYPSAELLRRLRQASELRGERKEEVN